MKTLNKALVLTAVSLALLSCSKDETEGLLPGGGQATPGGTVPVSVVFDTPDMNATAGLASKASASDALEVTLGGDGLQTKEGALAEETEKKIDDLWALQFNGTDDGSVLVYKQHLSASDLSEGTDGSKTAVLSLVDGTSDQTVWFVANVGADAFESFAVNTNKLSDFKALTCELGEIKGTGGKNGDAVEKLPMSGVATWKSTDASITVALTRLVSKIAFTCSVGQLPLGHSFKMNTIQLKNVPKAVAYAFGSRGDETSDLTAAGERIDYGTVQATSGTSVTWYMPENRRGVNTGITTPKDKGEDKAPAGAAYVEVQGSYDNGEGPQDVSFQIFLGKDATSDFNVNRNCSYTIATTIKGINENDSRVVLAEDLSVNPFLTTPDKYATANSYVVNKASQQYKFDATVMGNGKATTEVGKDQNTAAHTFGTGDVNGGIYPSVLKPAKAVVLWETGTKGSVIDNASVKLQSNGWVRFKTSNKLGGNAVIAVLDASDNILWSWHIWSTDYDPYKATPEAYKTRQISQSGYNSVTSRTVYMMDRNLGAVNKTVADVGSFGLFYQWGRKDPFIGSSATSGSDFASTSISGTTAEEQSGDDIAWGFVESNASNGTIQYAIAHPTTFIKYVSNGSGDWYWGTNDGKDAKNRKDNLWGNPYGAGITNTNKPNEKQGSKSIFDPCPPGWRVAPQDTWTNFSTSGINTSTRGEFNVVDNAAEIFGTQKGWMFYYEDDKKGNFTYYPAGGLLSSSSGALNNVGTNGYNWSSSPNYSGNTNAGNLNFNSGNVNPLNNNNRANGFPVRCAKHLR